MEMIIDIIKRWIKGKKTGIVHIFFHEGGVRKIRVEHDIK